MYIVVTTVEVERGSIQALADLFDSTNRELVADHDDWIAAYFTADVEASRVTVIAHWKSAESYESLRTSETFRARMQQFARKFAGPPAISINEVLVAM